MKRSKPAADSDEELARLIRRSRALDPTLKRLWLGVLPSLTPPDRARLRAILASDAAAPPPPSPPSWSRP